MLHSSAKSPHGLTRGAGARSTGPVSSHAQRRRGERGFSLVDSLVGFLLIAISVAGLHTVAISGLSGNLLARQNDQAIGVAAQKVEQVKRAGYTAATIGTTTESSLNAQGNTPGPFSRTTAITAGQLANTKQAQVTVTWTNRIQRTVTLTTLLTSAG